MAKKTPICICDVGKFYNEDELLAMPIADKYYIIHIPCGCKADEQKETR